MMNVKDIVARFQHVEGQRDNWNKYMFHHHHQFQKNLQKLIMKRLLLYRLKLKQQKEKNVEVVAVRLLLVL